MRPQIYVLPYSTLYAYGHEFSIILVYLIPVNVMKNVSFHIGYSHNKLFCIVNSGTDHLVHLLHKLLDLSLLLIIAGCEFT